MSRIKPIGFSILVKPDDVEEISDGGIYLGDVSKEQTVITEGTLLAIAEGAWSDKPDGSYPKVGDKVIFAKYAGSEVTINKDTGEKARLMVDEEVKAVVVGD